MDSRKPRLILTLLVIIGLLLVIYVVHLGGRSAQLTIEVAPSGSSIRLNGKGVREGVSKVKPGKYEVTFSHKGFNTILEKVELSKDEKRYVGAVLGSTSPSTADWYQKHPADAKKSESISSKSFDQSTSLKAKALPLLKELPYVDRYFRIGYGENVNSKDKVSPTAIYVRASSPDNRTLALDWIKQQGFEPSDYEIIFVDASNPLIKGSQTHE